MKNLFLLIVLFHLPGLYSQYLLEQEKNSPLSGDSLKGWQVSFPELSPPGENILWDYSSLERQSQDVRYCFVLPDSLLYLNRHRTLCLYRRKGDSLFVHGYENSMTRMNYDIPGLLLTFPFCYESCSEGNFKGTGKYCGKLSLHTIGKIYTTADAWGTLILPSGDTLFNVLRLQITENIREGIRPYTRQNSFFRSAADSLQYVGSVDTTTFVSSTYQWFAPGYRYPVFETIEKTTLSRDQEDTWFRTAYCYPPAGHCYLKEDKLDDISPGKSQTEEELFTGAWENIECKIFPNPVKSNLSVEVFLPEKANISLRISDRQGRILSERSLGDFEKGNVNFHVQMASYASGEYILQLNFENKHTLSEIILKQ